MDLKDTIIDFDNPREKSLAVNVIRNLRGKHRINVVKHRPRRSDRQNRFYWPAMVQPFGEFLREQGQEVTDDEAHEYLKRRFLSKPLVNPETGEIIGETTRSTTTLSTVEFNEYLDRVGLWLNDFFGFQIPSPADYHEREAVNA